MQVHRRAHTHAHTHTHTHTHIHIHTHTHTTHANIHIYTHTHSNTKVPCTRASARHTHEHTFTLMYITHNHTEARTSHEQEEARITGLHVLALGLHVCSSLPHVKGWPEPYVYTIYDCIFGDFPAKSTVYIHHIYIYIYIYMVLAIPTHVACSGLLPFPPSKAKAYRGLCLLASVPDLLPARKLQKVPPSSSPEQRAHMLIPPFN